MSTKRKGRTEPSGAQARAAAAPARTEKREPDFMWAGQPVYRCKRGCGEKFERIEDLAAVIRHEETMHPARTAGAAD